jgi:hypothetical protein
MKDHFARDHVVNLRERAIPAPHLAERIARLGSIELRLGRKRVAQRLVAKVDDELQALGAADLTAPQLSRRDVMVWSIEHI